MSYYKYPIKAYSVRSLTVLVFSVWSYSPVILFFITVVSVCFWEIPVKQYSCYKFYALWHRMQGYLLTIKYHQFLKWFCSKFSEEAEGTTSRTDRETKKWKRGKVIKNVLGARNYPFKFDPAKNKITLLKTISFDYCISNIVFNS
jgi:hypothetical protein